MFAQKLSQEQMAFATLLANQNGYKRVFSPTATLTLTQSGLLAVLLERQRYKLIQSAWRHVHHEKMRVAIRTALVRLFRVCTARTVAHDPPKRLMGTIPRHT